MTPLLSIRDLTVAFNRIRVLDNVSFDVQAGDIVSIIGPNGAGKTTLIKAILGLVDSDGAILLHDKPVRQCLDAIGYVPQRFEFDKTFPLSTREFLRLFTHRIKNAEQEKLCQELRIEPLLDMRIGELSGGQLQRVLIAQALIKQPKLLILDEPTSGVDVEGVKSFYELVEHLNKEHGMTVLLVSHELTMVYRFATKVVCLNQNLICFGDPATALTPEVMHSLYGENMQPRSHTHHA